MVLPGYEAVPTSFVLPQEGKVSYATFNLIQEALCKQSYKPGCAYQVPGEILFIIPVVIVCPASH